MSVKGTFVKDVWEFSYFSYVGKGFWNNMNENLIKAMIQLNIKSEAFEDSYPFKALAKSLRIKKKRETL